MKKLIALLFVLSVFCISAFIEDGNISLVLNRAEAASYNQVQAVHILVPTQAEAVKIREEIMTGKTQKEIFDNFTEAAKKYSKCPSGKSGGILGWFGHGDMAVEFENAAFNLPNGQVSEPVKTSYGWHLIYVISKK